ncbi:hypothetical protein GBA52_004137, partial [Prunus armeniaca]
MFTITTAKVAVRNSCQRLKKNPTRWRFKLKDSIVKQPQLEAKTSPRSFGPLSTSIRFLTV